MTSTVVLPVPLLDRFVNAVRRRFEDGLPWFDRAAEQAKDEHVELARQRAIHERQAAEIVRDRLGSYGRISTRR